MFDHMKSLQGKKFGFDPWVGKIPWRWDWQPPLVFLPGESQGQRSLAGYSPWGSEESDTMEWLSTRIQEECSSSRHQRHFTRWAVCWLPLSLRKAQGECRLAGESLRCCRNSEKQCFHHFQGHEKGYDGRARVWWAHKCPSCPGKMEVWPRFILQGEGSDMAGFVPKPHRWWLLVFVSLHCH